MVEVCNKNHILKQYAKIGLTFRLDAIRDSIRLHNRLKIFSKLEYADKCNVLKKILIVDKVPYSHQFYSKLIDRYLVTPKNEYSQIVGGIISQELKDAYSKTPREWVEFISEKILDVANRL